MASENRKLREIAESMNAAMSGMSDLYQAPRDFADSLETMIARVAIDHLSQRWGVSIKSVEHLPEKKTPPDCMAISASGERFGIEVTRLFDEATQKAARRAKVERQRHPDRMAPNPDPRFWSDDDLLIKIVDRLNAKGKWVSPATFDRYVVAIATDEWTLTHKRLSTFLNDHSFDPIGRISDGAIVTYDPSIGRHVAVAIKFN